jgi:hypothetical protein
VTDQQPAKIFHKLVKNGQLPLELLDLERREAGANGHAHLHDHDHSDLEPIFELPPENPYIRRENQGQGYFSCGWIVGEEYKFNFDELFSLFSDLNAERVKAVVNTNKGCFAFNVANRVVSVNQMSLEGYESRIEVIDSQLMPWEDLEAILLKLCGLGQV